MSKPSNLTERAIRPNDVPGRLLNMALLNIGSDDPNLRLAAYNLLYALSMTFNFDVGKQLLDAKGKEKVTLIALNILTHLYIQYRPLFACQQHIVYCQHQ